MFGLKEKKTTVDRVTPVLPKEIIDQIPIVNYDPTILEIDRQVTEFEKLLKQKREELSQTSYPAGFGQMQAKADPLQDAEQLIAGTDIEELSGTHTEDRRRDFIRQINALEKGISILQNQRRHALKKAIQRACAKMPQEVVDVFQNVIDTAEQLLFAIQDAQKVDEILNNRGLATMRRNEHLKIHQWFINLVHAGYGNGILSLPVLLEQLKKLWEREQ